MPYYMQVSGETAPDHSIGAFKYNQGNVSTDDYQYYMHAARDPVQTDYDGEHICGKGQATTDSNGRSASLSRGP
jgi:hypothetical protein